MSALLARTILKEPVLMHRTSDGSAVAPSDRRAHRFAPLHLGEMREDGIQCPYHELEQAMMGERDFRSPKPFILRGGAAGVLARRALAKLSAGQATADPVEELAHV